ncbi:ESX secretion-associated protein EspG [Amycolatopsis acidiphila]|uniref:ESX secretion-associated protein EspG n=1 Tax=Amycolatopsis acidiphila TaxID=715473 RepID=A0A557ZWF9_9PSEU|nr:ESX secretion-associated protein EspG [Amycolatopsis acidiphila]TVT16341.1 ESX secretion-associated protein EspG [Amycolatopsis acidiphila]UIJ61223.1 ESX secretion-associated protein EspG [Amycolatopsis acidiphila]GHG97703.1 ESX secretion-associated protein EspG [Amycolatopsis acidiphila]
MVSRFDFTLGSVEAVVVGRAVGVDVRVFPLRISNTTVDPVRFAKLARQVYFDLEDRRLSVQGELNRQVRLAFELLGEHRVAVTASGNDSRYGDLALFAATDGAQALAISQADGEDGLWFSLFPDEELVRTIAQALPAMDPAPTGPLSISHREDRPRSAMAARRQAEAEFDEEETAAFGSLELQEVVRTRVAVPERGDSDAELLEEIFAEPRFGGGYFTASGRGRHGERRSAPPLTWLDTEAGRYLVQTSTDGSGTLTARYVPAGFTDVAEGVRTLISAVY